MKQEQATVEWEYAKATAMRMKLLIAVKKKTYNMGVEEMCLISAFMAEKEICKPFKLRVFTLDSDSRFYTDRSIGIKVKHYMTANDKGLPDDSTITMTVLWHHGNGSAETEHFNECGHYAILWPTRFTADLVTYAKRKDVDKRRFYSDDEEFVYQGVKNDGSCLSTCIAYYLTENKADVKKFRLL
jgi:hypothetical protein